MKIKIIIVSILILCFIFLIINNIRKRKNKIINEVNIYYIDKSKQTIIPKKIWTYWHDETLPYIIKKCIENWKYYNSDYEIIILNNLNYTNYIKKCPILEYPASRFYARIADFMRIHVLNQNGGIWLDASIILHDSLNWVFKKYDEYPYEFIGYRIVSKETKPEYPVIENWFMAAPKGSIFIQKWLEKFLELNNFKSDYDYLLYILSSGIDLQNLDKIGYLSMHHAIQYVLQKEMIIKDIQTKLYLERAEDGPFKYLHKNGWKQKESIKALCEKKELQTKVVKFRKSERKVIEDEKIFCVFN